MIGTVIQTINIEIASLNQFDNIFELFEKSIVRGEIRHPNQYITSGSKKLFNWDMANAVYHRRLEGSVRESIEGPSARIPVIRETTPMRCVAYGDRVQGDEDEYSPEKVARNIATKITFSSSPVMRRALNMQRVRLQVTDINLNQEEVWDDETDELPFKLNSRYYLFAVDYEIEFVGRMDCFPIVTCAT